MQYNWQQPDWPSFVFDIVQLEDLLFDFVQREGKNSGLLQGLAEESMNEAIIEILVAEALKTSEIEGEYLNRKDVMSSIKRNLGVKKEPLHDQKSEGAAELTVKVNNEFKQRLTKELLLEWHRILMKGYKRINIGQWRSGDEPMQIISGAFGKEKVHFVAPPSNKLPEEMGQFITWFNEHGISQNNLKHAPVRAAIAHLYFESIHPFEDGNGRIGRAISEKALSEAVGRPIMISLSKTIEQDKKKYYRALKEAQTSNEVTNWLKYFIEVIIKSQQNTEDLLVFILSKAKFFDKYSDKLNKRQLKVVNKMLNEGPKGFEGGMTAKKYISIAKTSKATATRDLQDLMEKDIMKQYGGGRSTRYELIF